MYNIRQREVRGRSEGITWMPDLKLIQEDFQAKVINDCINYSWRDVFCAAVLCKIY